MKVIYKIFIPLCLLLSIFRGNQDPVFQGYKSKIFVFQGRDAKIIIPKKSNSERLWVWRARFWGHEPQTDLALLEKGYHIVYVDVAGLFGNEEAITIWNSFYRYLVEEHNLNKRAVLEAMSRGGLIAYNWAAKNTDKVFCIYADAPVCDIKSWPGGFYSGAGSEKDWNECLKVHHLDKKTVLEYKEIPIFTAVKVAEANIPVLHVCGDSDSIVPYLENSAKLEKQFNAVGGAFKIILKKGIGHHPHSLADPTPIVNFILKHSQYFDK